VCLDPGPFHLKLADGSYFELTTKKAVPIVSGGLISVFPGETVYVEARLADNRLVDLVAVDRLVHPEHTLVFTLSQQQTIGDGTDMMLKVSNTFPVTLKYRLGFMRPDSTRLRKTSSCPLKGGSTQYEAWPHPIFQIVAASFRAVPPYSEEAKTCD
jgi:hypothetical protein